VDLAERVKIDFTIFKHWGLVIDFGNREICYEIIKCTEGSIITPIWRPFVSPGSFNKMIELGPVRTSPAEVREKARTNRLSYKKYNLVNQNCQEWVEIMLKSMNSENLQERLKEENIKSLGTFLFESLQIAGHFSLASAPEAKDRLTKICKKKCRPNCLNPEDDEN
jgi:hypothetical protein